MDPNVLRVLTDPEARKDPARLRAAMAQVSNSARQSVLSSLRINSLLMSIVGYLLVLGGVAAAVACLLGLLPQEAGLAALLPLLMGGLFVVLARMTALPPRERRQRGLAAFVTRCPEHCRVRQQPRSAHSRAIRFSGR